MRLIISLLTLLLLSSSLFSQRLHAIMFVDTRDVKIGDACETDYSKMAREFDQISALTGLQLKKHYYKDRAFSKLNLENLIDTLTVGKQDVIYFYYSGHGFRYDNQRKVWPRLALGYTGQTLQQRDTDLAWVIARLQDKKSRLSVFVADCCNNEIGVELPSEAMFTEKPDIFKENYRRLFLERRGTIIACGAQPGDYSYCNLQDGGWFTNFLLDAFYSVANEQYDESDLWATILETAKLETVNYSSEKEDLRVQTPIFDFQASLDPFE